MSVKRWIALLAALVCCVAMTACGNNGDATTTTTTTRPTVAERDDTVETAYPNEKAGFQMEKPAAGDQIAILHTDAGDLQVRLFPEAAPKAVDNFVKLAQKGYYDGVIFYRIVKDSVLQTGDPTGTGNGGESADGTRFEDEFDTRLLNLKGSLAMANDGEDRNGSQFFLNHRGVDKFGKRDEYSPEARDEAAKIGYDQFVKQYTEDERKQYGITTFEEFKKVYAPETYVYDWIPDEVWDAYETYGGNLRLDGAFRRSGGHTVFGQIFEGMDVLDELADTICNSEGRPIVDVRIKSIEITTYKG